MQLTKDLLYTVLHFTFVLVCLLSLKTPHKENLIFKIYNRIRLNVLLVVH